MPMKDKTIRELTKTIDDALTPKKVKEATAELNRRQRKRDKEAKPFEAGVAGPMVRSERLAKNKKEREKVAAIKDKAVSMRKKALAAVGGSGILSGIGLSLSGSDKKQDKPTPEGGRRGFRAGMTGTPKKKILNKKDADPAREPSQDPGIKAGQDKARERIRKVKERQAADAEKAKMKVRSPVGQRVDEAKPPGEVRQPPLNKIRKALEEKITVPKINLDPRPKPKAAAKKDKEGEDFAKSMRKNYANKDKTTAPTASGPAWKNYKSVRAAQNAETPSKYYMGKDGKKKLAVTKEQLNQKKGETLTQAYNRYEGKTPRKSSGSSSSAKSAASDSGKKSFRERRAARLEKRIASDSGSDSRKAIQRKRLERVKKRIEDSKKKPKKMMGGGEAQGPRDRGIRTGTAGRYYQGGEARLDESLGERQGSESTKSQSMKSRRNESRGATKKSSPKSAGAATRGWGAVMR